MKKTTTKLQFKKTTIRILQDNELSSVQGGDGNNAPFAPTANCSLQQTGCSSGPNHTDHCHTWHCP